jgi:hypothetical protein
MKTSRFKRCAGRKGRRSPYRPYRLWLAILILSCSAAAAQAQVVTQRGFVEGTAIGFPQDAPNDPTQIVGDVLVRDELFVKPARGLQFAGGMELRANSHNQVEDEWRVDFWDRGVLRPRVSVRRVSATLARGPFTLDVGKQFIRWGAADIVNPTDRFAPRDFLNVVDAEFIGVTAARAVAQVRGHTFEAVWAPRLTPSRTPLVTQRWVAVPPEAEGLPIALAAATFPTGSQTGVRWRHVANPVDYSLSYFDGFNHLPDLRQTVRLTTIPPIRPEAIVVEKIYPHIRVYGGDMSWPVRWLTIKAEAAYFTPGSPSSDEYGLYVLQLERQSGEWLFLGGYAGETVTHRRAEGTFAPDRGVSRSFLGRVSRTVDVNRSVNFEGAIRQNGHGGYGKAEYSQAFGEHWRGTVTAIALGGRSDDFFGQYRRNSHLMVAARYSF